MFHLAKIFILIGCLVVAYLFMWILSFQGWGYAGYRGYHRGPSFFYFGGARYYPESSVRGGSTGGPKNLGGGPGSGK